MLKLKNGCCRLFYAYVFSFLETSIYHNIHKVGKKPLKLIKNDMMNFNEIFRKNVTCDKIKCHQKLRLHAPSKKRNFGNTTGGVVKLPSPVLLGLI